MFRLNNEWGLKEQYKELHVRFFGTTLVSHLTVEVKQFLVSGTLCCKTNLSTYSCWNEIKDVVVACCCCGQTLLFAP